MILTCLAFAALAQTNQMTAENGKLEVPLTFQAFDKVDEMTTMYMGGRNSNPSMADRSTRIKQYTVPKSALSPVLFRTTIDNKQYAIVAGKSKAKLNSFDLLWVDWNGDKTFSDDEQAKLLRAPKTDYRYGGEISKTEAVTTGTSEVRRNMPAYFVPKTNETAAERVMFMAMDSYLQVMPGGIMVGTLPIGKGLKIGICDSNMNGSFGDAYRESEEESGMGDLLFIDSNKNGKFDEVNYMSSTNPATMEALPFMGRLQLDGKKFYDVEFDPDGRSVSAEVVPGPYAKIKFVGATVEMVALTSSKGYIYGAAPDGLFEVPAGEYTIQQVQYSLKSPKGDKWTTSFSLDSKKKTNLTADKETVMKCGLPLNASIEEVQTKQDISFTLNIKDAGGHSLGSLTNAKGKEVPAPSMLITNAQGKLVKTLTFSYG